MLLCVRVCAIERRRERERDAEWERETQREREAQSEREREREREEGQREGERGVGREGGSNVACHHRFRRAALPLQRLPSLPWQYGHGAASSTSAFSPVWRHGQINKCILQDKCILRDTFIERTKCTLGDCSLTLCNICADMLYKSTPVPCWFAYLFMHFATKAHSPVRQYDFCLFSGKSGKAAIRLGHMQFMSNMRYRLHWQTCTYILKCACCSGSKHDIFPNLHVVQQVVQAVLKL